MMIRKLLFFAAILCYSHYAFSSSIPDLISSSGNSSDYPNQNMLIIFDSTSVDMQETGLSYYNTHSLYKVLTKKGARDFSIFKYGYDPLSAYVDIKMVKIYRANGDIEELDMSTVLDYPAPARMIYWGAREKMIEIGRLNVGDAVELYLFKKGYTYALLQDEDDKYIPPMRGHFYDIVPFWTSDPLLHKYYSVSVPKDKLVQYKFYNGSAQSSVLLDGDNMVYSFEMKNMMPMKREPNMVALSDVAPKLLISTSPDWYAKSMWFYNVNEDYGSFESNSEIDKKVSDILKGAKTELDSISLLTHWAADEIRYSGISMGPGEGYTLHNGDMNFTDRCGVCKDKAGMLITMLRAAGFESYPAMTMAGSRIDYIPADQFNHSVTIVKLKSGEYKILDPTWVPFLRELWSSAEQQQNYLIGLPEGADLMETPISAPENHFFRINGSSQILADGTLKGEFLLTAEGQSDAAVRRMFTSNYKTEWKAGVEKELLKVSPQAKVLSIDYGKPYEYQKDFIHITVKYEIPAYAIVTEEEIIFTPLVASNLFKRGMSHLYINTSLEKREYPYRDRCSRLVELNETIKLPKKGSLLASPSYVNVGDDVSSFEGTIGLKGKSLSMSQKVALGKRIYDTEDWTMFRKVVQNQSEFANKPIIIELSK